MIFTQLLTVMLAENASGSGIKWWVALILIIILLVILWFWFGREDDGASSTHEPDVKVEPVARAEVVADAPAAKADDLKKIEGIGPKVSSLLNEAGITTYQQMVDAGAEKLEKLLDDAGLQMINADTWPEQAALAAAGDWATLGKLQDELKGGKRL